MRETLIKIINSLILAVIILSASAIAQQEHKNPSRGIQNGASYSISDIETINTTNGNVMLNIPLASLPKGRGEVGKGISLRYNSKLYDTTVEEALNLSNQMADQNFLSPSEDGGWKYVTEGYQLEVSGRFDNTPYYQCGTAGDEKTAHIWKVEMVMPDGSRREFRPYGYSDNYNDGYFTVTPNGYDTNGCGTPSTTLITSGGMTYYSTDGSYTRLFVSHVSGSMNTGEQNAWVMSMPDGSKVTGGGGNPTTLVDRNGNSISGLGDVFGRSISIQYNAQTDEDHITMQGVDDAELKWKVKWKTIEVEKEYLTTGANSGRERGGTSYQDAQMEFRVVDRITLPTQLGSLYYEFEYNSADWGEISQIKMPSGATVDYEFTTPNILDRTDNVLRNHISEKTLTYNAEYDGSSTSVSEVTTYDIGKTQSVVTNPDGSTVTEYYGDSSTPNMNSGLVYTTIHSNGSRTDRIWDFNRPPGSNTTANINAYVKTEFTTIPNASGQPALTAIKDVTIDPNGNQTVVDEYDWSTYVSGFPSGIPSIPIKRRTATAYNNTVASSSSNAYWTSTAPLVRNAASSVAIYDGDDNLASYTEITYDNAATTANPTVTKVWDSFKSGSAQSPSSPLTSTNSISTSVTYNSYGMPLTTTDANGVETTLTYGCIDGSTGTCPSTAPNNLYPTKTEVASNYSTLKRTSTAKYDFYTGVVTEVKDVDNDVRTVTEYDDVGRPVKVRSAYGTTLESWVQTTYDDTNRRVIVKADLETIGDAKKVATQFFDQLGRVRLAKTLEDAATQSATNETDGIKVQTRYKVASGYTYQVASNPYRATTSSAETDATMGWTLSTAWSSGIRSEVQTFSGAGLPSAFGGSNTSSTGIVRTDIDANATTVTDQASKVRRSITNALGQLTRVDEPTSSGLGTVNSPNQATSYTYNTLGKMVRVHQGVQTRYFMHDSLGRMLRVKQPEQDANSSLNTSGNPDNNSWTAGFTYDNNGNVLTTTDAKGTTITNTYDALNRLLTRTYSNEPQGVSTPTVINYYDGLGLSSVPQFSKGKLTRVTSSVSDSRYTSFDVAGRLLMSEQRTPLDGEAISTATVRSMSYQYNLSGSLTQETYPSGRVVNNEYDSSGDITKVTSRKNSYGVFVPYASNFSYSAAGAVTSMRLGNGKWETMSFSSRLQPIQLGLGSSNTDTGLWKINYEYGELQTNGSVDAVKNSGNIAKQTLTLPGTSFVQAYKYDSLNRLTEAKETTSTTQNWMQNFGYDIYGNRTSFSQTIGSTTINTTPTVNSSTNRFNTGQGFLYDANGNLTQDVDPISSHTRAFTFNGDNKQTQIRDVSNNNHIVGHYSYDGEGKRVKKVTDTETTIFIYSLGRIVAEYSTQISQTPSVNYTTTDHLGSPRVITDELAHVKARRDFMPFGEDILVNVGARTATLKYGSTQDDVKQKFTGYLKDSETSLDFAEARMYENRFGRFTAIDPLLASGKSTNPQSFNRFSYVVNNPLRFKDPDGLCPTPSLQPGQVGLCFEAFIAAPNVGAGGLGHGDNRTFTGNDASKTARVTVTAVVSTDEKRVSWVKGERIEPSVVGVGPGTVSIQGSASTDVKLSNNQTLEGEKDFGKGVDVTLSIANATNGAQQVAKDMQTVGSVIAATTPTNEGKAAAAMVAGAGKIVEAASPAGTIDGNVTVRITGNGQVQYVGGESRGYPSYAAYAYTVGADGKTIVTQTLVERRENKIEDLTRPMTPFPK